MTVITSLHNPVVKLVRSLETKKHRQESGLFVAEGAEVLARARSLGWKPEYLISDRSQPDWDETRGLTVSANVMEALSGQRNPQGVIGVFRQRFLSGPILPERDAVWVGLDGLRDPGNLGTIIRTADAVSAQGVILIGPCCDPYSREAVRASMGSIFAVPLLHMTVETSVEQSTTWPGETVGTRSSAESDFRRSYRRPTFLLIGGESVGLSANLLETCDSLVRIPMAKGVESLNAAIATALMLYEIDRTRA